MSRPYKAYTAEVVDLANASEEYKDILSYGIGDTVTLVSKKTRTKEKQRIVKIREYPETPKKNTVEISKCEKDICRDSERGDGSSNRPDILLADEPTGNLDPGNSMEIMKLLEEINNRGTTVLVVTHNREIVNSMKKRVITMRKGVVVSDEKEGEYHEV